MFDKINFMSVMDIVQLLSRARSSFSGLFGHKEDGAKPAPTSEMKGDEGLPTGLISEKFTRVDESQWQQLMLYLAAPIAAIIRKIITEMKRRDDKDHGSRVDSFRIGVLIMTTKVSEEIITKKATQQTPSEPGAQQTRRRQQAKQPAGEPETITRKIDPRFTDKDSRVLYLNLLAGRIQSEMSDGKNEAAAIAAVIDYLEADGFLTTGEMLRKAKKVAEKTAEVVFEETLRFRLGDEYDGIKNRHPQASAKQLRELRLCALHMRESYRKQRLEAGARKELSKRDWIVIAVPIAITLILVIGGLIYNIFK